MVTEDAYDLSRADIKFKVNAENIEDSNRFLRKFYDSMSKKMVVAWNCCPERNGNTMFLGWAAFGATWITYKQKGKIDYIYIDTGSDKLHDSVLESLNEALEGRAILNDYDVAIRVKEIILNENICAVVDGEPEKVETIPFRQMCKDHIEFIPEKDKRITTIVFRIQAYGEFDLKYVLTQKMHHILYLLCAYTNCLFKILSTYYMLKEHHEYDENYESEINEDWIECEEIIQDGEMVLLDDFFRISSLVIKDHIYDPKIRRVLNSAQELYCARFMSYEAIENGERNIPGYADLVNTTAVSALEPLTGLIQETEPKQCPECGNLVYSISKRVRDLTDKYAPSITKVISDCYKERSQFLHEGVPFTNQFYTGVSVPLINPIGGNCITPPVSKVDLCLYDYCTYIFRHCVHDLLIEKTETTPGA